MFAEFVCLYVRVCEGSVKKNLIISPKSAKKLSFDMGVWVLIPFKTSETYSTRPGIRPSCDKTRRLGFWKHRYLR